MKNIFLKQKLSLVFVFFGFITLNAQLRFNDNFIEESPAQSMFLDAASTTNGEDPNGMVGKGLLFPRVDLVNLTLTEPDDAFDGGFSGGNPNEFDGMIVYNTGTGTVTKFGGGTVAPGFYYYDNSSVPFGVNENRWNQGTWRPLGGGSGSKYDITSTEVETNAQVNNSQEYAIRVTGTANGTTTQLNLGTTTLAANTVNMFRLAKIYDQTTGELLLNASGTYNSATNVFTTGDGMVNLLLPAGTYDVELFYTK